jgi:hypothetical protein
MKTFYLIAITAAFLFYCCNGISAQTLQTSSTDKVEYYKVSEVRIFISNQSDIKELRKQGLGFEHLKLNDTSFDVMLDIYQLNILRNTGYRYEILIEDVTKNYLEQTKESSEKLKTKKATITSGYGLGSMGGFYTFSEVVAQLDAMRSKYPNLISAKDSIGISLEGRPIWAVKISDNPDVKENEPEIFYNALTHAREPQGMMCVLYFMFYLLENYGIDPEVTYLVNNRELHFVPVINPDGYVYNEQISPKGGGMWRPNRRDNGGGIFGVDLNRNYGYMWGYDDIGSSPDPWSSFYRGTGPFSEPETQAVRHYCINHNFVVSNNYHSWWNAVFPPWSYNLKQSPDSATFNNLIKLATATSGYRNGIFILPPERYLLNGDVCDWMYGETSEKNRIFAVLTEVGNASDGFWPKPERIIPIANENLYSNLVYAWGPGLIENPPFIKHGKINTIYFNPKTDTLKFIAIEQNPDNHTSKVYAQILNSKGSVVSEALLSQTDSIFNGNLSMNSFDEDFYEVQFKQCGIDIPSNFYYSDTSKLRFNIIPLFIVQSVTTDKLVYSAGNDTVKTSAFIENPNSYKLSAKLIFESVDGTVTDSTDMAEFNLNEEAKWQAKWKTYDLPENMYCISLKVTDKTDGKTFTKKHVTRFTNIPLTIGTLSYTESSDKKYSIKTELKHSGESMNIIGPIIKITSENPWIKSIAPEQVTISVLKPGDIRRIPPSVVSIDEVTFPGYVNLTYSISERENDWPYWVFDTTIYFIPTGLEQIVSSLSFNLEQNYPNPFNSITTIPWQLAESGKVTLKVLDIVGRTVSILVDEQHSQGKYETQFNAATLPKGIYFYQLKAGENVQTRKMILLE